MAENVSAEIVSPLLRRHRSGRAGFLLVLYPGDRLPEKLAARVVEKFTGHDIKVDEVTLEQLAPNPVSRLVELRRDGKGDIFSIHVQSDTLLTSSGEKLINALNLHRDSFRDQKLHAIFWIPEQHSRRFFDQAFNFADYRTRLVEVDPADVEAVAAAETPATLHNLPFAALARAFKGRGAEMAQLAASLKSGGVAAISQPVGIQGLGGIGKTRLAVEYAWGHLADYSHILFVRADTPAALSANIAELAEASMLDLPEQALPGQASRYEAVIRWLECHNHWLLIVDNADDESASEAVMALLPKLNRGAVIITSRYRRWGSQLAGMDLDTLPPDEAVRFLLDQTRGGRLQTHDDPHDAAELARLLGYLPLALEQSAAQIRREHLGFRGYLDLWNREREQVLSWHDESVMGYPYAIATTWRTSIVNLGPLARLILRILAWFAPDPVPISVLADNGALLADGLRISDAANGQSEVSESQIMDAVDDLTSLSLLDPAGEADLAMHRLIQQVERTNASRSERSQWISLGVRIVNAVMPENTDDVRTWGIVEPLRPHAQSLLSMAEEYVVAVNETSRLMSQLGVYFLKKALFVEAEPLLRRALAIDETSLGSEHPNVATHLNNLAQLLQATNRPEEAEPLSRRMVEILVLFKLRNGHEHPNLNQVLINYTSILAAMGRDETEQKNAIKSLIESVKSKFNP